jgi:mannosyltransferase OCH1-like enzyme
MNVYQTWISYILPDDFENYHKSWLYAFNTKLYNDTDVYATINDYCLTTDPQLCKHIYRLSTIQLIDVWRYIIIYQNGGLYSDIDIGINNPYLLYKKMKQCNLVIFKESPCFFYEPLKFILHCLLYFSGIKKHPRFNQYRQSIFFAKKHHPLLQSIIYSITHSDIEYYHTLYSEPYLTLEFTGPGLFTDKVLSFLNNDDTCIVQYNEGLHILDYHHYGTWKSSHNNESKNIIITLTIINVFLCFSILLKFFWCRIKNRFISFQNLNNFI